VWTEVAFSCGVLDDVPSSGVIIVSVVASMDTRRSPVDESTLCVVE
jgi:hypothetical protein